MLAKVRIKPTCNTAIAPEDVTVRFLRPLKLGSELNKL